MGNGPKEGWQAYHERLYSNMLSLLPDDMLEEYVHSKPKTEDQTLWEEKDKEDATITTTEIIESEPWGPERE